MTAIFRLLLLAAAIFGAVKLYPHIKPQVKDALGDPRVLGESIYEPIAAKINDILPDNINLPTKKPASPPLAAPSSSPVTTNLSNLTGPIVDQIKQKAGDLAKEQIENIKQEAGKAFCQALLEKIKTECGQ